MPTPDAAFVGEIMMAGFFGNGGGIPRGYMPCNGQLLAISQYQALFSLLGTNYGGDGRTTFGLPDLRGRVPMGTGTSPDGGASGVTLGEKGGSLSAQLLTVNLPSHLHAVSIPAASVAAPLSGSASGPVVASGAAANQVGPANKWLGQTGAGTAEQIYTATATPAVTMGMTATVNLATATAQVNLPSRDLASGVTGSGVPFSTLTPYQGVNFYICVEGIFPSRN